MDLFAIHHLLFSAATARSLLGAVGLTLCIGAVFLYLYFRRPEIPCLGRLGRSPLNRGLLRVQGWLLGNRAVPRLCLALVAVGAAAIVSHSPEYEMLSVWRVAGVYSLLAMAFVLTLGSFLWVPSAESSLRGAASREGPTRVGPALAEQVSALRSYEGRPDAPGLFPLLYQGMVFRLQNLQLKREFPWSWRPLLRHTLWAACLAGLMFMVFARSAALLDETVAHRQSEEPLPVRRERAALDDPLPEDPAKQTDAEESAPSFRPDAEDGPSSEPPQAAPGERPEETEAAPSYPPTPRDESANEREGRRQPEQPELANEEQQTRTESPEQVASARRSESRSSDDSDDASRGVPAPSGMDSADAQQGAEKEERVGEDSADSQKAGPEKETTTPSAAGPKNEKERVPAEDAQTPTDPRRDAPSGDETRDLQEEPRGAEHSKEAQPTREPRAASERRTVPEKPCPGGKPCSPERCPAPGNSSTPGQTPAPRIAPGGPQRPCPAPGPGTQGQPSSKPGEQQGGDGTQDSGAPSLPPEQVPEQRPALAPTRRPEDATDEESVGQGPSGKTQPSASPERVREQQNAARDGRKPVRPADQYGAGTGPDPLGQGPKQEDPLDGVSFDDLKIKGQESPPGDAAARDFSPDDLSPEPTGELARAPSAPRYNPRIDLKPDRYVEPLPLSPQRIPAEYRDTFRKLFLRDE